MPSFKGFFCLIDFSYACVCVCVYVLTDSSSDFVQNNPSSYFLETLLVFISPF